jgi:ABC-type multidrug transport system ATPase subunit
MPEVREGAGPAEPAGSPEHGSPEHHSGDRAKDLGRRALEVESNSVLIATIALVVVIGVLHPDFLTFSQLSDVVQQSVYVGIIAAGMAFLISMREIDLSVGSMFGLTLVIGALLMNHGMTPWLAVFLSLLAACGMGLFNAVLVQVIAIPTIVATLATLSLRAKPGEIVGLAGVVGAGHLTVFELVSGLRRADGGEITLPGGRPVPRGLRRAIRGGVALVSGDRRRFGLMLDKPIWENIGQVRAVGLAASGPIIRASELRERARGHVERLSVQAKSVDERVELLSGGNQQKVVFAKWLDAQPAVLLLDDPTRGVDVGAKAEMNELIRAAAAAGAVVLLCSTDIDEIAELCDRVIVFFQGEVCAELSGGDVEEHVVLEAMNTGSVERAA